ncbi:alpha/beta fold hydrolase [Sphingomonas lutea]
MLVLAAALAAPSALPAAPHFETRPCLAPAVPRAVCGTVVVPEDRARPDGRRIALNVIVLKSATPATLPPLFDIEGGPGLPSTRSLGFYAGNGVAKGRDVVLVDQRGTGRSNGLLCPKLQTGPDVPMLPLAAVAECRKSLSAKADLRFYGTRDAVTDLDDVRRALGYRQIDLFGLSYGTTVALRFMHRYPDTVRAAVLMGVAPPDLLPPQHHATAADRTLKAVFADCAADARCRAAFPDLPAELAQARAKARRPGAKLADELLMERLRALTYRPASRVTLPLAIKRAAAGNVAELVATPSENLANLVADGMFLAVTCGESFPLMDYGAAVAAARRTPFGDYRLRRQKAACAGWPVVARDPDHLALPTRTSAAILLVSGELDPVTPSDLADRILPSLRRARHVVVPDGGHIPDGVSGVETCLDPLMIAFLDHADPSRLDVTCIAAMKGPPYAMQ